MVIFFIRIHFDMILFVTELLRCKSEYPIYYKRYIIPKRSYMIHCYAKKMAAIFGNHLHEIVGINYL